MAYKLNFKLDVFKDVNSILSEVYSEYFLRDGYIYGTSKNTKIIYIAKYADTQAFSSYVEDAPIPPEMLRGILANCKKSRVVIPENSNSFEIYQFPDKVTEPYDLNESEQLLSIKKLTSKSSDPYGKHLAEICKHHKWCVDAIDNCIFNDIDLDEFNRVILNNGVFEYTKGANCHLIVTADLFPRFNKIKSLALQTFTEETWTIGVFEVTYDNCVIYAFGKYINF